MCQLAHTSESSHPAPRVPHQSKDTHSEADLWPNSAGRERGQGRTIANRGQREGCDPPQRGGSGATAVVPRINLLRKRATLFLWHTQAEPQSMEQGPTVDHAVQTLIGPAWINSSPNKCFDNTPCARGAHLALDEKFNGEGRKLRSMKLLRRWCSSKLRPYLSRRRVYFYFYPLILLLPVTSTALARACSIYWPRGLYFCNGGTKAHTPYRFSW